MVYATWAHWGLLVLLASWVARVYDYARVALVLDPGRGAVAAVVVAVGLVLRHGTRTFLLWALLGAVPLALVYGCVAARTEIGMESMRAMWLALAVGQVGVGVRLAGGIALLGGQMRFGRSRMLR